MRGKALHFFGLDSLPGFQRAHPFPGQSQLLFGRQGRGGRPGARATGVRVGGGSGRAPGWPALY